ncbi:MAG: hypothetical protein P8H58_02185 [Luminiphilus sp.]|nr:hypothetical protein [Luminiphilus sp.]
MAADDYKTVVTRVNVPRQRRIRIAAASAVLVFAVGVYFLGYQHGFDDRVPLVLDEAGLKETISKLKTRVAVDKETLSRLRTELSESARGVDALERELVFYRDIMSSTEDVSAVKIRPPDLNWDPELRQLEYRAVVQRLAPGSQFYRGQLRIQIVDADENSVLLEDSDAGNHDLAFKYFQRISGTLTIPANISPAAVRFDIELVSPRKRQYEQNFDWSGSIVYSTR